ncbi:hypothetical protein HPB47_005805 [Ixodes persulcatus]|uniref:Uncharacterized protein n=1 Tax=Ixodes persulcatus TaxID=34615 RepID=A0AC60PBX1_IXOPE|nr:hypothetical protein HPB47_005805 [Ixodes persulcatus]
MAIYAIAVCNARRFSYLVRHKQLPPEILLLFGGFKPSQGHGVRMCKFLSSEWHRPARFYKECLLLMLQGTTTNPHGSRKWREFRDFAYGTADFRWRLTLSELHASGQVSLPESIRRVLDRGSKYAVEPRKSWAELLSLVRGVARKVPETESERSLLTSTVHGSYSSRKLGRLERRDDSNTRVRSCFPAAFLRPPARIATGYNSMALRLL